MALGEWKRLTCDCGGDKFVPLVHLKYREGGGTTNEPAGHQCVACQGTVDNARMIRLQELAAKRQQIKQLQEEIEPEVATKK